MRTAGGASLRLDPWRLGGLAAAAAAVALIAAGAVADSDEGVVVAMVGVGALAFLAIAAPIARYGAPGIFLTPGVLLVVAGLVGFVGFEVAGETVETLYAGDDDGDGVVDEDGPGDADGSEEDPTQVSGIAELLDHADDDADGKVDEDPPPITVASPEARALVQVGAGASAAAVAGGLVMLGVFFGLSSPTRRSA